MGLDQPAAARYLAWLGGLAIGDFGTSYTYGVSVWELVRERIGLSLPLAVIAICLSTVLAIPLGVLAAARRNRAADVGVMGFTQLGIAIPNFWFALLLILLFAVHWQILPAGGFARSEEHTSELQSLMRISYAVFCLKKKKKKSK